MNEFEITTECDGFDVTTKRQVTNGVTYFDITAKIKTAKKLELKIKFYYPHIGISSVWGTDISSDRAIYPEWWGRKNTCATYNSPIRCFTDDNDINRLTYALSDTLNTVGFSCGVNEANSMITNVIVISSDYEIKEYSTTLRIDERRMDFSSAIGEVGVWWENFAKPAEIPNDAKEPMYSTWYSYHQSITPEEICEECRLAKNYGMESVIVDDGWQTENSFGGYNFCGDWNPSTTKIPDMRNFVDAVHKVGMKFMLWFSVPFVGEHSEAFKRFQGKLIRVEGKKWYIFDPRYPDVREYLIGIYKRAVNEWGIDGLKLDFVDSFAFPKDYVDEADERRDFSSMLQAVDKLLSDTITELKKSKQDILIEFRQRYTGPLMRTYGNMFRAADCPNDYLLNRIRTIDLRLICGSSAVHSDMLMWNTDEPTELAALQFLNIIFSVPQISVKMKNLPEEHKKMLKFMLVFWKKHRAVLIDEPVHPKGLSANYTSVYAENKQEKITVLYNESIIKIDGKKMQFCFNATLSHEIIVDCKKDCTYTAFNCMGEKIKSGSLNAGSLSKIDIPTSALVEFYI